MLIKYCKSSTRYEKDLLGSLPPWSAKSSNQFNYSSQGLSVSSTSECATQLALCNHYDKVPFVGHHHLPKFWDKKPKVTTMVTLKKKLPIN